MEKNKLARLSILFSTLLNKIGHECVLSYPLALAGIVPFFFTAFWLYINTQLPVSDPANFLATGVNIYQRFTPHFFHGLLSCYDLRGFRPISFPVFLVPILLITHGQLLFAYSIVALLSLIATLGYVYLFFRLALTPRVAIIATNLIGLLPMLQAQILGFYAESFLFPCLIGSLYHLLQSDYLRNKWHVLGFILTAALAITLRPVEVVIHLFLVISLFLYIGYTKEIFTSKELHITLGCLLTALFIFLSPIASKVFHHRLDTAASNMIIFFSRLYFSVFLSGLVIWLSIVKNEVTRQNKKNSSKKTTKQNYLILGSIAIFVLVLVWFEPFAFTTFEWIYRTSFGDIAHATVTTKPMSLWEKISLKINAEGNFIFYSILGLVGLKFLIREKSKDKKTLPLPVICLLLMTPLVFIEMFTTVQDIHRKLSVAMPALLMAGLYVGLAQGRLYYFRVKFAVAILILQILLLTFATFGPFPYLSWLNNSVGYYVQRPVKTYPNPHNVLMNFLTREAQNYHLNLIKLVTNPNTIEPVDPFLMNTLALASHKKFGMGYQYFNTFSTDNIKKLSQEADAVFIADAESKFRITPNAARYYFHKYQAEKNPSLKTMYLFLYLYASQQLAAFGWYPGPCLHIKSGCLTEPLQKGIRNADCFGCLLIARPSI